MNFQDLSLEEQEEAVDGIVQAHIDYLRSEGWGKEMIENGMPLYKGVAWAHLQAGGIISS